MEAPAQRRGPPGRHPGAPQRWLAPLPHTLGPGRELQRALDRRAVPDDADAPHWPARPAWRASRWPAASATENRLIRAHGMHRLLVSRDSVGARPRASLRRFPSPPQREGLGLPAQSTQRLCARVRARRLVVVALPVRPLRRWRPRSGAPLVGKSATRCSASRCEPVARLQLLDPAHTGEGAWHSETACRRARGVSCSPAPPLPATMLGATAATWRRGCFPGE